MDCQRTLLLVMALAGSLAGCAHTDRRPDALAIEPSVKASAGMPAHLPPFHEPMALASDPIPAPPELFVPQPVDVFIRRALAENRTVQAAYHNVQSLRARIPQVTALDDPVASNVVFPIPSVAPQYFLMGYNPYNLTLRSSFPGSARCGCAERRPSATCRLPWPSWQPPSSTPSPP